MEEVVDIWSLKLDGDVLGVRVRTSFGRYYDIGIGVFKKDLRLDPSRLMSLKLLEFDGVFMTEEEFTSGVTIEAGNFNDDLLQSMVAYMQKKNKVDPVFQEKKRKKVEEMRQAYYTYLPQSWLRDFAEYAFEVFDGNRNLYDSLTDVQFDLVKKYFRWRSRSVFKELKVTGVFVTKPTKAQELANLMGDAEDWVYDGTVDTGELGGGVCELGHPLRYEHYAYSETAKTSIIFGTTCMSDFFEVDPKVVTAIKKTQETLMKELRAIVYVMQTDKADDYIREMDYQNLNSVLKYFSENKEYLTELERGWIRFMSDFSKRGMPLTRSMVDRFRKFEKRRTTGESEFEEHKRQTDLIVTLTRDYGYAKQAIEGIVKGKYKLQLSQMLREYFAKGVYDTPFVVKGVELSTMLHEAQLRLGFIYKGDLEFTKYIQNVRRNYSFTYGKNGRRLSTKKELGMRRKEIKLEPYLGFDKTNQLTSLLVYAKPYNQTAPDTTSTVVPTRAESFAQEFMGVAPVLTQALYWSKSTSFFEEIRTLRGKIALLESAYDELTDEEKRADPQKALGDYKSPTVATLTPQQKYDFIARNAHRLYDREKETFSNLPKTHTINSVDLPILDDLYLKIAKTQIKQETPAQKDRPKVNGGTLDADLEYKLDAIEEAGETGMIAKNHFVFKVIPTIRKTGRMSVKQQKFIDEALNWINNQF